MRASLGLAYGVLAYAAGFGSLAYAILFLNDLWAPVTIRSGPVVGTGIALLANLGLVLVFALQHSVMARAGFKAWLVRRIPAFAERSTYVLLSGVALGLLYVGWRPMPEIVWQVEAPALRAALLGLQALGWGWLVASTFMLDHLELFGLRQVAAHARGAALPAQRFRMPGFYRVVRHPIQLGVLVSFWATPDMDLGRLVLCLGMTAYILVALTRFEERDLVRAFGDEYRTYQARVGMLLPRRSRAARSPASLGGEPAT